MLKDQHGFQFPTFYFRTKVSTNEASSKYIHQFRMQFKQCWLTYLKKAITFTCSPIIADIDKGSLL